MEPRKTKREGKKECKNLGEREGRYKKRKKETKEEEGRSKEEKMKIKEKRIKRVITL